LIKNSSNNFGLHYFSIIAQGPKSLQVFK